MHRLQWLSFEEWLQEEETPHKLTKKDRQTIATKANRCLQLFQKAKPITEDVKTSVEELVIAGNSMEKLMKVFVQQGKNSSDTFLFWDNYITDWAQLLLDYNVC